MWGPEILRSLTVCSHREIKLTELGGFLAEACGRLDWGGAGEGGRYQTYLLLGHRSCGSSQGYRQGAVYTFLHRQEWGFAACSPWS